jgi:hypothetical protein
MQSGLLQHIFRNSSFPKPSSIAIALTSGVPVASQNGTTIPEMATSINGSGTGYSRLNLGNPSSNGDGLWSYSPADYAAGSGVIRNANQLAFNTALCDWGWISGIAVLDNSAVGSGNLLYFAQLQNPRTIFMGDGPKFDASIINIKLN